MQEKLHDPKSTMHFLPHQGVKIDPMPSNTTHAYTSLGYSTPTKPGCLVFAVLGVCSHYSDSQLPITLLSGDTRQNGSVRLSIFMHFYRVLMTFPCCHLPTGELLQVFFFFSSTVLIICTLTTAARDKLHVSGMQHFSLISGTSWVCTVLLLFFQIGTVIEEHTAC